MTEVPWFISLLQSRWHLVKDDRSFVQKIPTDFQQSSAILVSIYNETRFAEICFKAVRKFTTFPYHLVAINNSTEDIREFKKAVLQQGLVDEWFDSNCTSHNDGLQKSLNKVNKFRYITTLDSDAIVLRQNWLTELVARLNHENAGLIGPQWDPSGKKLKSHTIHPCCMVIDKQRIGAKFQIDFCYGWPWDVGGLITWDCLAHRIPIIWVSHEVDGNYMIGSSLINKSVRHYWYTSQITNLDDDAELDGYKVSEIRQKVEKAYRSAELEEIRKYRISKE